jgi:hypothetical protein
MNGKQQYGQRDDKPKSPAKPCEWCGQSLPTVKYHLRICPDCRRASINAFVKSTRYVKKTDQKEPSSGECGGCSSEGASSFAEYGY